MNSGTAATQPAGLSLRDDARWRERSGRLFLEFQRPARAMVRRAFRGAFSSEEVDDIYAGAWVGVLRALAPRHEQLSDDEVRSYVLTAVAHQAGKELRRRRRKPTAPLELVGGVADTAEGPDERLSGAEQARIARDLLASLPPRRRAVMLLRYGWGLEPRQVCNLLTGLSPRAYRKEITRGVDELTEKMRTFERGEWCAEREPVLKAYAAGLADDDQRRQARAHLSHCRACCGFVARLSGHLHDLGGAVAVPAAMEGFDRHIALSDRLADLGGRARDAVTGIVSRGDGTEEVTAHVSSAGGMRGAGAAGAGVLAKVAGLGAGGKFALACLGGGAAATACVAAGVGPLFKTEQPDRSPSRAGQVSRESERPGQVVAIPEPTAPPSGTQSGGSEDAPTGAQPEPRATPNTNAPESSEPVAPDAPPIEQEFGVASAATGTTTEPTTRSAAGGGGGTESAVRQEFAP